MDLFKAILPGIGKTKITRLVKQSDYQAITHGKHAFVGGGVIKFRATVKAHNFSPDW